MFAKKKKKQPKKKSNLCSRWQTRCHRTPSGPSLRSRRQRRGRRWRYQWLRHLTIQTSPALKPVKMKIGSPRKPAHDKDGGV